MRRFSAVTAIVSAVVAAAFVVALPVGAVPSTKYYTAAATPTAVDVSTVATTVTFTLGNCGATCPKSSTQSWGSAHVTLPAAWNWGYVTSGGAVAVHDLTVHNADGTTSSKTSHWSVSNVVSDLAGNTVVRLGNDGTNSAYAVAAGESLTFTASLTPSPAGLAAIVTQVKQSNDFSGTGNDFLHSTGNTDPTIVIGAPDHLEFGVGPQTVQQSTGSASYYMCDLANHGPTVRVVDKSGSTVTWVQGLAVTLVDTNSTNPGLSYKATTTSTATTTLRESTVNGVATFGSACTSGLAATNLGGGYELGATATLNSVALSIPAAKRMTFDVLQYYQPCVGSCDTKTITSGHTGVDVQATGTTTNRLATSLGIYAHPNSSTDCHGDDGNPLRSIVSVDIANHSKNVLLSWDKQAVQWATNNGTPFWDVCMWATYAFPTLGGGFAQPSTDSAFFIGVLPNCGDANVTSVDPCISSLYRRAGVEYAAVTLPLDMPGDPQFK